MRTSTLWKGIVLAAAIMVTPLSAMAQYHGGRCDRIYEDTIQNCRAARAQQCENSRHDARRACRSGSRYDCRNARQISDNVCSARGCRSQAEAERRACFRERGGHRGPRY